jgi:hypothetical protein
MEDIVLTFQPKDRQKIMDYAEQIFSLAKVQDKESAYPTVPCILEEHKADIATLALKARDSSPSYIAASNGSVDAKGMKRWLKVRHPTEYHAIRMHTLAQLRGIVDGTMCVVRIPLYNSLFPKHKSLWLLEDEELEKGLHPELKEIWRAQRLGRPSNM